MSFATRQVREGLVDLLVPDVPRRTGPGVKSALPFYNPAMAIARDVSVLLAERIAPPGAAVLDGLAAAGALGLRIAVETSNNPGVTLNDRNPQAVALIQENARRNHASRITITHEDFGAHVATHHYDLVEIDPFGSPVPFLDAALRSAHRGSFLAVAATDTAVLCGAKPEACTRRYLARVRTTDAYAEVGARVLMGYIARMAGRFDKAIEPLVVFGAEHFLRAYVGIAEGAARTDRCLSNLGWIRFDPSTGGHDAVAEPIADAIGPLWLGPLVSSDILGRLEAKPYMGSATARLLDNLRGEEGFPPFYFENNATAGRLHVDPPGFAEVIARIRGAGHRAVPTHFRRNAFKTDAAWEVVRRVYGAPHGS